MDGGDIAEHSRKMSEALEKIGISSRDIEWRRKLFKHLNFVINLINSGEMSSYITGSRAEGIGLMILRSDFDTMYCLEGFRVISSLSDWEYRPATMTMVIDTEGVHPGYCHLIPLNPHEPTFGDSSRQTKGFADFNGTAVLNHDWNWTRDSVYSYKHGPAITYTTTTPTGVNIYDMDEVACFSIPWPRCADEWLLRDRASNFPPAPLVGSVRKKGSFVVPTGHKESPYSEIEWRFSFSLQELEIIHIWPNNATLCYVVLKLLIKQISNVSPGLSSTLSSYHLKTLIFWLTEELGSGYWNDRCLVECLILCFSRLVRWVKVGYIPHYFIKNNNLFDTEVGTTRQRDLIEILNELFLDESHCISPQKLYHRFWSVVKIHDLPAIQFVVPHERLDLQLYFAADLTSTLKGLTDTSHTGGICESITGLHSGIERLQAACPQNDPEVSAIIKYSIDFLKSMCGSLILSFICQSGASNSTTFYLNRVAGKLLKQSAHHPSEKLRLANFYYKTGKYKHALQTLTAVLDARNRRTIKIGEAGTYRLSMEKCIHQGSIDCVFGAFSNLVSMFVFVRGEINTTPLALQYEMFKSTTSPRNIREHNVYAQAHNAIVDPDVLTYYLQYLCYNETQEFRQAQVALDNLIWIVTDEYTLSRATAFNVLGHCYLRRGDNRRATTYFVKSIYDEPRYTAALVHLAIAIKNAFLQRSNCV